MNWKNTSPESEEACVYVVDDDPGVLSAVQFLLKSVGLHSVGFSSALEFLAHHQPDDPGCLVLDLRMPGMSGIELHRRLQEMGSGIPIIFVTAHGDIPTAVEAMKAGALDFIQKPFPDQKLLDKVNDALALDVQNREIRRERTEILERQGELTPRERDVMASVVQGKMNKNIARELGISQRTVEIHRRRVMEKMRAGSVQELVQMVVKLAESTPP